jgi:hypothetical protein
MTHIAGFERDQLLLLPEAVDDCVDAEFRVLFHQFVLLCRRLWPRTARHRRNPHQGSQQKGSQLHPQFVARVHPSPTSGWMIISLGSTRAARDQRGAHEKSRREGRSLAICKTFGTLKSLCFCRAFPVHNSGAKRGREFSGACHRVGN